MPATEWRTRVVSEYQRYEFMTIDRPLTRAQLDEVNELSSHIEASSTHALIEYHWGDFKHDPIKVLREFFDGFLYWANWGSPELAFRFPHGICLPISSLIMILMISSHSPGTRIMISSISILGRWKVLTNGLNMNLDHLSPFVMN